MLRPLQETKLGAEERHRFLLHRQRTLMTSMRYRTHLGGDLSGKIEAVLPGVQV